MRLFNRSKKDDEDSKIVRADADERTGTAWLLAFATLLATVLIALVLFFGGRWVYRKIAGNDKPQTGTGTEQVGTQSTPNNQPSQPPNPPIQGGSSSGQSGPATSTTQTNNKLSDAGPGDTIAIFIGTVAVGTLAHELYLRRKLASN